jgi:hypothetical protein
MTKTKMTKTRIRWAKAVYVPGVRKWYVRIGGRNGEDPMLLCAYEQRARTLAANINATLSRLVNRRLRP